MIIRTDELMHYGVKRRSGRYPWGSGDHPFQSEDDFLGYIRQAKREGLSEKDIAKGIGIVDGNGEGDIKGFRRYITIANNLKDIAIISQVNRLHDDGYKNAEIAKIVGKNESSVRELLSPLRQERVEILERTKDILKQNVEEKKMLDVGAGVDLHLGIKRTLLDTAVFALEHEGYSVHEVPVQQVGTGKATNMKVLTKSDMDYQEVRKNQGDIRSITDWSKDGGETYQRLQNVKSLDSSRIQVRYKEDGGANQDGMILLRRGVEDLSLGDKAYAQVRIAVDGTHFMKGMAVYDDNMPKGVDVIYNSNKSRDVGPMGAFKRIDKDGDPNNPTNPFKTAISQSTYLDKNGTPQLSLINKVGYSSKITAGEEGYWDSWHSGKALASQFLSKQSVDVANQQLKMAADIQKAKLDDINLVTNPAVKQRLLDSYADDCDAKAVHLEGAALPRQSSKVLLSVPTLKENEVYSPAYKNGETVMLVRYPHAGTFEIPLVKVNNTNPDAIKMIGKSAIDAIGIHPKAAEKLSGADFDGDSVVVIPYSKGLKSSPSLQGLKDFDSKVYKYPKEITNDPAFKKMSDKSKGVEMGKVSNLITDMQIMGATPEHLARAVRHSMVVIDAQKHDLNWKQSERDNGIKELKSIYQGGANKGASTLLSRSTSEVHVTATRAVKKGEPGYESLVRRNEYSVDPTTGRKVYGLVEAKAPYINKAGQLVVPTPKKKVSTRMYETEDALSLIPKTRQITPMEQVYAKFANEMKALGNQARKESVALKPTPYSKTANQTYKAEVNSLNAKLNTALRNQPLERQAQVLANVEISAKKSANPNLTTSELRRISGQAITDARLRVGAGKQRIEITEQEWKAIQAGAITHNKLSQILNNSKIEDIQKLATPRSSVNSVSPAIAARARSMMGRYTLDQIADMLGISTSTVASLK